NLGVDGGESHGQFLADGILAFEGKRIGNAGDSGGDVDSVKSGEDEMTGFGGGYRDAHGFRVAHFAYDDYIRGLTESGAKRGGKIGSVGADFDLLDDAAHMLVLIFDGIFDDDDVAGFAVIDFVDERSHGGGLSGAGRTAEQDESARDAGKIFDRGRKTKFAKRRHAGGQSANGRSGAGTFAMEIDAVTAQAFDAIGTIGHAGFAKASERVRR